MILEFIQQKFNVLNTIKVLNIDDDMNKLVSMLNQNYVFNPNDRYVVLDTDTHYYMPDAKYSLAWFNIIKTFLHLDIPLWTMIVVCNGTNLQEQLDILIPKSLHDQMPTVIDLSTALTAFGENLFDSVDAITNNKSVTETVNQITHHCITMIGVPRVHRNMLFYQLKEKNLLDKVATSYKNVS
tara:strand:+ start:58 stop:606 length:549 start_codon:yes stop_codon:yes gene_type:complete